MHGPRDAPAAHSAPCRNTAAGPQLPQLTRVAAHVVCATRAAAQGDEDTRRAMMKSFVESNGTVLSTNWQEVGAKRIDCTPPEGMELRKWNE
jgi:hypothetical protein